MLRLGYPQGRARVPVIHRDLIDLAYNCIYIDLISKQVRMKEKNISVVSRDAPRRKGKTDLARVDATTDEEIERAVRSDSDAVPLDIDWSKAVVVIPPKKKAISIRVDEDVLNYFKKQGSGYQRRMNAVLRFYVEQKRRKRA
jgi:uncharacterized protein (DUF4415 family)